VRSDDEDGINQTPHDFYLGFFAHKGLLFNLALKASVNYVDNFLVVIAFGAEGLAIHRIIITIKSIVVGVNSVLVEYFYNQLKVNVSQVRSFCSFLVFSWRMVLLIPLSLTFCLCFFLYSTLSLGDYFSNQYVSETLKESYIFILIVILMYSLGSGISQWARPVSLGNGNVGISSPTYLGMCVSIVFLMSVVPSVIYFHLIHSIVTLFLLFELSVRTIRSLSAKGSF
jgi:hypothetical protein